MVRSFITKNKLKKRRILSVTGQVGAKVAEVGQTLYIMVVQVRERHNKPVNARLVVQYTIYSTRGVVSCCKSRTALRARINYYL